MSDGLGGGFGARSVLETLTGPVGYYRLERLSELGVCAVNGLPYALRVWLESLLRQCNGREFTDEHVLSLARWSPQAAGSSELPFKPARVLLQDLTGVPAVVDLAALRSAMQRMGGEPLRINPQVPVDLVIDHSIQVDEFGSPQALQTNSQREFERNRERYVLLHWAQSAFRNLRVIPPATGIVHQVNLEYLAEVVVRRQDAAGHWVAFPDSLVGTDSHTTMINGLGVVGWGVGGIEAEAVMLGEPLSMLPPEVIGVELTGEMPAGATATDLVLTVTQRLRARGVVGKFVEFCGTGVSHLSLPDRATIANMAPEYGATVGFFPVDGEALRYLRNTGRPAGLVDLVERYTKAQGLFRSDEADLPRFTELLTLELGTVEPSLAGPKRPQDRVALRDVQRSFRAALRAPTAQRGYALDARAHQKPAAVQLEGGERAALAHGSVVLAAITSCTNTSNPGVMIAAGLLARKAVKRGLRTGAHVKTSLAPGSKVVTRYLERAGLMPYLERLGFHVVGYGCTTCIGNSGALLPAVAQTIQDCDIVAAAVLSGNRNFEGRVHPQVRANYLASPPLVVAYALAGTVDIDLESEPLGRDGSGRAVFLRDIWPSQAEIHSAEAAVLEAGLFTEAYSNVFSGNEAWNALPAPAARELYVWDPQSTYIQEPPFFAGLEVEPAAGDLMGARVLALLGDSVTTDHISPAGSIGMDSPAGRYLLRRGVARQDFNSLGSRRGNHEVMMRGTFANVRLKNLMLPGTEGGNTLHVPSGEMMSIYDAAVRYRAEGIPLLVVAGTEYGTGSSRDWAAKGVHLLGVKAVLAESYERIHRSNLVGMGVLPLQFMDGQGAAALGLIGLEEVDITGIAAGPQVHQAVHVTARRSSGPSIEFDVVARLDTPVEAEYYRNGGILQAVLRRMLHLGGA